MAVLVICGVNEEGRREILAAEPMAEESEASYIEVFRKLKERGMGTPKLAISDAHTGLVSAIRREFPGASWQRCKVHFMRNILAHVPQKDKETFAAELKEIWTAPDESHARDRAEKFIAKYEKKYSKAIKCLEDGLKTVCHTTPIRSLRRRKYRLQTCLNGSTERYAEGRESSGYSRTKSLTRDS